MFRPNFLPSSGVQAVEETAAPLSLCYTLHFKDENTYKIYSCYLLSVSHETCFLKPVEVLNVKISSESMVYANYMFRPTLLIFRWLKFLMKLLSVRRKFKFWGVFSSMRQCFLWWQVVPPVVSCVAVMHKCSKSNYQSKPSLFSLIHVTMLKIHYTHNTSI
jgi:hypothetical protein